MCTPSTLKGVAATAALSAWGLLEHNAGVADAFGPFLHPTAKDGTGEHAGGVMRVHGVGTASGVACVFVTANGSPSRLTQPAQLLGIDQPGEACLAVYTALKAEVADVDARRLLFRQLWDVKTVGGKTLGEGTQNVLDAWARVCSTQKEEEAKLQAGRVSRMGKGGKGR